MLIRRLLIANRGEIVCRIARTARRLGITTIAVYSDADRNARHVRLADEAYRLGAAPAAESYLDIAGVLALAKRVRPGAGPAGHGFWSENAAFAKACSDAGLAFIGPPAAAITAMGSKSASKAAMAAVGVPVAPGYHGAEQSLDRLRVEAERVGFPLIIKASAGGAGRECRWCALPQSWPRRSNRHSGSRARRSVTTGCSWSATSPRHAMSRCRDSRIRRAPGGRG